MINIDEIILLDDRNVNLMNLKTRNFQVFYNGFIFTPGFLNGPESIIELLKDIHSLDEIDFNNIFGNYFILISDLNENISCVFTDNSGIYKGYTSNNNLISNSFLQLCEVNKGKLSLNKIGLNEFLHFGFTYFQNTVYNEIRRIHPMEYLLLENKSISIKKKEVNYNKPNESDFDAFFQNVKKAIGSEKTSIDLTGGTDSRLILSYMWSNNLKFETAVSGIEGNTDIKISNLISKKLNISNNVLIHKIDEFNPLEILKYTDGQIDLLNFHRKHSLNIERKKRSITMHLSGSGGELYKDFWWLQDFPFYNKKNANLNRLYLSRIEPIKFPHRILSQDYKEYSLNTREKTINELKNYKKETNTQTYDSIYYNYKMMTNAGINITSNNQYFKSYAPLLELHNYNFGFNLKRKQRFFNYFHRKKISQLCPEISNLKTTENVTCSNNPLHISMDILTYFYDKFLRVLKFIIRKIFKKTFFQERNIDSTISSFLSKNNLLLDSIETLRNHRILNEKVDSNQIPPRLQGRIITLGLLLYKYYNN